ncbi:MAG: diguanylate cyclase [Enterobacterales bacterium]|nr:diguanylate cyclase [Enterobacterales bacterium]
MAKSFFDRTISLPQSFYYMTYFPWIIPSIVAASICMILALLVWPQRKIPAAKAFYWFLTSIFIWSISQTFTYLSASLKWKLIFAKIQYIGIVFVPVSYLVYGAVMLDYTRLIGLKFILTLSVIPLITLCLTMTNEYHHLIWQSFSISKQNPLFTSIVHGQWFSIHTIYSYTLILMTALIAVLSYFKDPKSHVSFKSIIFAPMVVTIPNVIYLQKWIDIDGVDLTPLGFSFALLIISWALLKENVLQLIPIARDVLFQKMKDPIVVIGEDYRIVDFNSSAAKLFKVNINDVRGTFFTETISDNKMLTRIIESEYSEVMIKDHYLQTLRTLVTIEKTGKIGYLIVFRDITELKEIQNSLQATRMALEQSNKALKLLANTDPLTGLPNRRHLFEKFSAEVERSDRYHSKFCLLIMDLDDFKKINDQYGHPTGDEVLKRVSTVIKQTVREADHCGRIGGEEFAIILTESDKKAAKGFAERIRKAIEVCHSKDEIAVTVSIGLTQRLEKDDLESIYDRADKALYQSKDNGRNQYTLG